jgi:Bacterial sugar transferase
MRDDGLGRPSEIPLPRSAEAASSLSVSLVPARQSLLQIGLHHLRRRGRAMSSMLVVGADDAVVALAERTRRAPSLGWCVRGACTSTGAGPGGATDIAGVPVLGDLDSAASLALTERFDAVAVCPTPGWTPSRLQQLAWDLDGSRTALLVDPRLVGHGRGVRATGVVGLPLLQLSRQLRGEARQVLADVANRLGALVLLLLTAPLLLSCAVAVRRDGGPALIGRPRVGRHGRTFSLLAFRTTTVDGRSMTPVGRVLRRRCLDELPQLLNVLGGSMALVGPRPLVPDELGGAPGTPRRLLVKPGMTTLNRCAR